MTSNADSGARKLGRDVHYAECHGPLCPCFQAGLRAGERAALDAMRDELSASPNDGSLT